MNDKARKELLKELARSLISMVPWLFGVHVPIPVGLLVILAKTYHDHFSVDFFKQSVGRVRAEIAHSTRQINEVLEELKHARSLEVTGKELLEVRVDQLEEKLELLESKRTILSLALMVRERVEFHEKEFGKGIWRKISDYPQDVWEETLHKTLKKYDEEKLNIRAFRDVFIEDVEKEFNV